MIEEEILSATNDDETGQALNDILDEFHRGRDTRELLALLRSSNTTLVSTAAWILSELRSDQYDYPEFIPHLCTLLQHEDAQVRFHSIGAVYPLIQAADATMHQLLEKLVNDPNEGVRRSANAAIARLSSK